jgi:hypothetical protein
VYSTQEWNETHHTWNSLSNLLCASNGPKQAGLISLGTPTLFYSKCDPTSCPSKLNPPRPLFTRFPMISRALLAASTLHVATIPLLPVECTSKHVGPISTTFSQRPPSLKAFIVALSDDDPFHGKDKCGARIRLLGVECCMISRFNNISTEIGKLKTER